MLSSFFNIVATILLICIIAGKGELDTKNIAYEKRKSDMLTTANSIIRDAAAQYPPHLLLATALKTRGAFTDEQLQRVFRKCLVPGSLITVAAVGGSITAGAGDVGTRRTYVQRVGAMMGKLCPNVTVEVRNAATGARGSLLSATCLTNFVGPEVDLLLVDFTLNDYFRYPETSAPFELLLRATRVAFPKQPPAVIAVYFWGQMFKYDSAQDMQVKLCDHYGVTGISMRDVVWPLYEAKQAPYEARDKIVVDEHHPTLSVHNHLGTLISYYIADRIIEWGAQPNIAIVEYGAETSVTNTLTADSDPLPAPLNPSVEQFHLDLESPGFKCGMIGTPQSLPSLSFPPAGGWKADGAGPPGPGAALDELKYMKMHDGGTFAYNADIRWRADTKLCFKPDRPDARVLWEVDLQQGYIMAHRCYNERPESRWPVGFSFLLVNSSDPSGDRPLKLIEAMNGTARELHRVEPLLPPGRHTIAIVIEPFWKCAQPPGTDLECEAKEWAWRTNSKYTGGFDALITM